MRAQSTAAATTTMEKSADAHQESGADLVEIVRRETVSIWGGRPDVWAISVQTKEDGKPFVLFGLGYDAGPFPDTLTIEALNGRVVPLHTEVVGKIVPL